MKKELRAERSEKKKDLNEPPRKEPEANDERF